MEYFVINEAGDWVKFEASRVKPSAQRPEGIQYSITLHDARNHRILGFDNAHAVRATRGPARRKGQRYDHRHIGTTVRPYVFVTAERLVEDFWAAVDRFLAEKRG